jgi:biopolymer transport protein ExbD
MKLGKDSGNRKVAIDMTPMIDVVFQLMIFFMLTLKIKADEGDFNINMPLTPTNTTVTQELMVPDIKVRLTANSDGSLQSVQLGRRNLGNDDRAFGMLNSEILNIIGRPGNPLTKDVEVEIDADYELHYQDVVKAIGACTGRVDRATNQVVRYVEKIKFAAPRQPKAGG